MSNSPNAPLFKFGFGPAWDQLFAQSNFGIVTRMGLWLMPEPEATTTLTMHLPEPHDLGWLTDVLTQLRIRRVVDHNVGVTSYMGAATQSSQRNEWYQGPGALPDEVVRRIIAKLGVGWWNFSLRLYGTSEVNAANERIIRAAFAAHTSAPFGVTHWMRGEAGGGAPAPSVFPLQVVNWHGGRGGHLGFSPVMPASGRLVLEQLERTRARFHEYGVDYSGTFYASGRHVTNVNLMLYDRDDAAMTQRVRGLFETLVKDSAAAGYAEYRTHLSYMDAVAATFDFNDHALLKLNEAVKDALDPNGILAPGKSGIWPKAYRSMRGRA
jgi:4-cresol dehydrogenase (hydroxylating)